MTSRSLGNDSFFIIGSTRTSTTTSSGAPSSSSRAVGFGARSRTAAEHTSDNCRLRSRQRPRRGSRSRPRTPAGRIAGSRSATGRVGPRAAPTCASTRHRTAHHPSSTISSRRSSRCRRPRSGSGTLRTQRRSTSRSRSVISTRVSSLGASRAHRLARALGRSRLLALAADRRTLRSLPAGPGISRSG